MDEGSAQLKIMEINLNKYLDQCEDYNNDMEVFTEMVKPFNHITISPIDAASPGKKQSADP